MENVKYRHELKYQCSEAQLAIIKSRVQSVMRYDSHAQNGRYTIRSMYFDSVDNKCYYENENGTDPREKFRIRIYNGSADRISLECKRKEHGKTFKTACLLTMDDYNKIMAGGDLSAFAQKNAVLRKFTLLLRDELYRPAVIVEYDRTPFVYPIGNVRVTLDQNIRSSNDFGSFFDSNIATRQILPRGQHLLEVKYDELLPDYIKEVLELGNLQQSTFSKYYLCRKYAMGGNYDF